MERMFLCWLKPVLVLSFVCSLTVPAAAQNYYPAEVGNTWVLEDTTEEELRTYSLEGPETFEGTEVIALKIETEKRSTGELDLDQYFLTVGNAAIRLHGTVLEEGDLGTVTTHFPIPATFFPLSLELGDKWQIDTDAVKLSILPLISGKSTTNLEVVAFEDLVTPAGTFHNCAKVALELQFNAGGFINVDSITYQWLAPDVGPVQYQNSDGLLFKLVSSNVLTAPEEPDTTTEDVTPEPPAEEDPIPAPLPYDVTGDGVVNILDLTFVASRFGTSDSEADVTGDGVVNILDLVRIAQNFS